MLRSVIPYDGFGRWVSLDFVHFGNSSLASPKPTRFTVVMQNRQTAPKDPGGVADCRNFSKPSDVDQSDGLNNSEPMASDVQGAGCRIRDQSIARRTTRS